MEFKCCFERRRVNTVIFNGVSRSHYPGFFKPGDRMNERKLHIFRQRGRQTLKVHFLRFKSAWLYEELMAFLVGKTHNLIFKAGAVPRTLPLDFSAVKRGAVQIFKYDLFCVLIRICNITAHLVLRRLRGFKAERHGVHVALLNLRL